MFRVLGIYNFARGTDYAHLITTGTPGFSDLPTALQSQATQVAPLVDGMITGFFLNSGLSLASQSSEIVKESTHSKSNSKLNFCQPMSRKR